MSEINTNNSLEVIVLAGGLGTRLREIIPDRQKVVAPIGGTPILEIILKKLFDANVKRVILCVGYLKETVVEFIREEAKKDPRFLKVEFSEENEPLGTGGAIKRAGHLISGEDCVVINGDTLSDINLLDLQLFHKSNKNLVSIAVSESNNEDGGRVKLGEANRIVGFQEKSGEGKFVSAGVYVFSKKIFPLLPDGPFSIEKDFFPKAASALPCRAFIVKDFLDIGTPERYKIANEKFS